ncbi:hypothetical protein Pcinc_012644, partial [Petrolisthes cinctipes]
GSGVEGWVGRSRKKIIEYEVRGEGYEMRLDRKSGKRPYRTMKRRAVKIKTPTLTHHNLNKTLLSSTHHHYIDKTFHSNTNHHHHHINKINKTHQLKHPPPH